MKILVVGSGAREHAICWALSNSPKVRKVYCAPGNAGTATVAQNVDIATVDFPELIAFAKNVAIDITICPMDEPLVNGIVDAFTDVGLKIYGPSSVAAHIEGSKAWAKMFMDKYEIPTMEREVFSNFPDALAYAAQSHFPIWVKVDGLAAGKGAIVCCNVEMAERELKAIFVDKQFGDAGSKVVIEEHITGVECSVLAFCDGENIVPMPGVMDHKAAYDGDIGPNTGGMGAITPNPYYTKEIAAECMQTIYLPTIRGMKEEGREFTGVLFFGLMITAGGPKVLEFNCRPGDPETQTLLPLLETDLFDIIQASLDKNLDKLQIKWKNNAVCCVVLASGGYPASYRTGHNISGLHITPANVNFFHAGTKLGDHDNVITNGGRVISVVAEGIDHHEARTRAYNSINNIRFRDMQYRKDIGTAR